MSSEGRWWIRKRNLRWWVDGPQVRASFATREQACAFLKKWYTEVVMVRVREER